MMAVRQEEETGCAIASVATLVQQPYVVVKAQANSMGIFATDKKLFSKTDYMRQLLTHYQFKVSKNEIAFESWQALPNLALLAIKHHYEQGQAFWHWVVFRRIKNNAVVFDSAQGLTNNKRVDFENMKPKWFIEVSKKNE